MDKEKVYDQKIAPLMTKIIAICKREKIPLVATFEYATGELASTVIPQEDSHTLVMRAMEWCIRSAGPHGSMNVDKFMTALMRHAEQHGHSSLYIDIIQRAMREACPPKPLSPQS